MASPAVALLSLALLAVAPAAAADLPATGCVQFESGSDEGPVKAGQEDPGVFVGAPVGSVDALVGPATLDSDGGGDKYVGVGVFYRNQDCEFPAVAQALAETM